MNPTAPKFFWSLTFQESVRNQLPTPECEIGRENPWGGGTPPHTLPIRVCAAQQGRDFDTPDLERGTHFTGVF